MPYIISQVSQLAATNLGLAGTIGIDQDSKEWNADEVKKYVDYLAALDVMTHHRAAILGHQPAETDFLIVAVAGCLPFGPPIKRHEFASWIDELRDLTFADAFASRSKRENIARAMRPLMFEGLREIARFYAEEPTDERFRLEVIDYAAVLQEAPLR